MLGLKDKGISFPKDWLENVKIKEITAQAIKGSLSYNPNRWEKWKHENEGTIVKKRIQNTFELHYSSGVTEGLNNKIK